MLDIVAALKHDAVDVEIHSFHQELVCFLIFVLTRLLKVIYLLIYFI